jgi:type I restriction enzyme S subunit
MRKGWIEVALGEILSPVARFEARDDLKTYQFAGTYSYARGIFRNELKVGSSFNLPAIQRIEAGDFIYCKIMAWEGAFGLAGEDVDNCWMSGAFVAFRPATHNVLPKFLHYWFKTEKNWRRVAASSTGPNVRRKSLHPDEFLKVKVPLPPLAEQQRIVAHLDAVESCLTRAQKLRAEQEKELLAALRSTFHHLEAKAEWVEMSKVAPVHRRQIEIRLEGHYPELGARSFGRGIFHKPTVRGESLTWQKLFEVKTGDIVISNIKAWEGALAVAGEADDGRYGSHRYLTCVADTERVLPEFVCFYLLSPSGLEQIGRASPGSADRNRTLAVDRLEKIKVPVVPLATQREFKKLLDLQSAIRASSVQSNHGIEALLPSILDRLFNA